MITAEKRQFCRLDLTQGSFFFFFFNLIYGSRCDCTAAAAGGLLALFPALNVTFTA
jgi:hypothetical protein